MKRKGFKRFTIIIHCLIVAVFLLVALVPFTSSWIIAFLGLVYPFLLFLVILCLVISILVKTRWFILPLAALVLSWQQITALVAFHTGQSFQMENDPGSIRVLSWNVSRWTENKNSMRGKPENSYRFQMMQLVLEQNADVLCFQEFFQCYAPSLFPENIEPIKKMGYPYYYFTPSSITVNGAFQTGLAIFSKYPITDSAYFKTVSGGHSEGYSYADILFNGKTVRVFNTHLESPGIREKEFTGQGKNRVTGLVGKIRRSYNFRSLQADQIGASIKASPHPVIFCGDLGDVPNSYSYFTVRGNLQDVFLKKGSGFGRTYRFISPTLRIDYLMADKNLIPTQFNQPGKLYSDHYPLVSDLVWRKE